LSGVHSCTNKHCENRTLPESRPLTEQTSEGADAGSGARGSRSMLSSVVTVSGVNMVGMGVGLVQNMAIAAVIGATAQKDAYDIAAKVPHIMLYMFGLDLLRGISVSLFSRLDVSRSEDTSVVFSTLVNALLLVSVAAMILAEVFARPLVAMVGPGMSPATMDLSVRLARVLVPAVGLIAMTSLMGSVLLAHHYYGLTEALACLPRLFILVGVVTIGHRWGVWVLAFAMILGLAAQLPVMIFFLRQCGLHYRLVLHIKSAAFRSAVYDAIPLGLGTIAVILTEILLQRTVSRGAEGTIACYNYALLLSAAIIVLIGRPVAASLAPRVTRNLEAGDYASSQAMLGKALGFSLLVCLTGLAVIWAQGTLVVDLFFGRGRFTTEAIEQTSRFIGIMFPAALGFGVRMTAIGVLLARRRVKTVMVYCFITGAIRAAVVWGGWHLWGVYAAAYAYTFGHLVDGFLGMSSALAIVGWRPEHVPWRRALRWLAGAAVVFVLPNLAHLLGSVDYEAPLSAKVIRLGLTVVLAAVGFVAAAFLAGFGSTIGSLLSAFSGRWRRRKAQKE